MIAETSINGYIASAEKHEAQRVAIVKELNKHPEGMTRRMLSRATGIENSAVSARVNELVAQGYLVVVGSKKEAVTGHSAEILKVAQRVAQQSY